MLDVNNVVEVYRLNFISLSFGSSTEHFVGMI